MHMSACIEWVLAVEHAPPTLASYRAGNRFVPNV
jgi:hypothetical protein